jgi:hypothetical protein
MGFFGSRSKFKVPKRVDVPTTSDAPKPVLSLQSRKPEQVTVLAYGFDTIGFHFDSSPTSLTENTEVEFCPFANTPRLDQADGVIIPQGIFEQFVDGTPWPSTTTVRVYEQQLLECDRQVANLLEGGKWACFLVGAITDFAAYGYGFRQCNDTDLCKRVLNRFGIKRSLIKETPCSWTRVNEFGRYFREYGVARTAFDISWSEHPEARELGEVGKTTVAFELFGRLFFLPCHPMRHDKTGATELVETVASAIIGYQEKRMMEQPTRGDRLEFGVKEKLPSEPQEHHE